MSVNSYSEKRYVFLRSCFSLSDFYSFFPRFWLIYNHTWIFLMARLAFSYRTQSVRQNVTLKISCFDCLQLLGLYLSILWLFFGVVFHNMLARLIECSYFILYLCNVFLVLVVWFLDLQTQEKDHVIKGLTVVRNKDSWYLFL